MVLFLIAAFAFIPPRHHVIGHWKISYPNGTSDYLDLKLDGTFRNFNSAGKTLHVGNYKVNGDTLSINDKEGCGDTYWATYKLSFFGEDSASYAVIEDSCSGRREAINGGGLKRLKNK